MLKKYNKFARYFCYLQIFHFHCLSVLQKKRRNVGNIQYSESKEEKLLLEDDQVLLQKRKHTFIGLYDCLILFKASDILLNVIYKIIPFNLLFI